MNSSSEGSVEDVAFGSGFGESNGAVDRFSRAASGLPGPEAAGIGWGGAFTSGLAAVSAAVEEAEN